MEILTVIVGIFAVASILATVAASFYGVRQKTIIATLRESNDAYKERNDQLEKQIKVMNTDHKASIDLLTGQVTSLQAIKTPPYEPLFELIELHHKEVMKAIKAK